VGAVVVVGLAGGLTTRNEAERGRAEAMAQAKEALIGYAARYRESTGGSEVFGYLPCPDSSTSGSEGSPDTGTSQCASKDVTAIGRLPWRELGLKAPRDEAGECLWYAVSGTFKGNLNKTDLMNWDTQGQIEVMGPDGASFVAGSSPTDRAAAVIFAPGAILSGQDRSLASPAPPTCGGNYTTSNYLDTHAPSGISNSSVSGVGNALTRFIAAEDSDRTAAAGDSFNDRLLVIKPSEIFERHVEARADFIPYLTTGDATLSPPIATGVLATAADCIVAYGRSNQAANDKRLPWAAAVTFTNYGSQTNYADASNYYSGRLPMFVPISDAATSNNAVGAGSRLLTNSVCSGWSGVDEFWDNYKDHFFYAVAKAFAPNNPAAASQSDPCSAGECLTVDGVSGFAAVLVFANKRQSTQSRVTNTDYTSPDRGNVANFLEGVNATSIQDTGAAASRPFSRSAGNDVIVCVRHDASAGLVVDANCSNINVCTADADILLSYRSGNTNNCKAGKKVIQACKNAEERLKSNNCSCKKAAEEYLDKPCIDDLGNSKCPPHIASLEAC